MQHFVSSAATFQKNVAMAAEGKTAGMKAATVCIYEGVRCRTYLAWKQSPCWMEPLRQSLQLRQQSDRPHQPDHLYSSPELPLLEYRLSPNETMHSRVKVSRGLHRDPSIHCTTCIGTHTWQLHLYWLVYRTRGFCSLFSVSGTPCETDCRCERCGSPSLPPPFTPLCCNKERAIKCNRNPRGGGGGGSRLVFVHTHQRPGHTQYNSISKPKYVWALTWEAGVKVAPGCDAVPPSSPAT